MEAHNFQPSVWLEERQNKPITKQACSISIRFRNWDLSETIRGILEGIRSERRQKIRKSRTGGSSACQFKPDRLPSWCLRPPNSHSIILLTISRPSISQASRKSGRSVVCLVLVSWVTQPRASTMEYSGQLAQSVHGDNWPGLRVVWGPEVRW